MPFRKPLPPYVSDLEQALVDGLRHFTGQLQDLIKRHPVSGVAGAIVVGYSLRRSLR